ncbi:hypothetical protein [Heyndrickxia ginsengihumi]|uniref:hypothetical protein n=1 Tax=Heyndrickxia ginsengihumi TaxID=363870 RepID=UPI00203CBD79|nr:hypothetical protein [Heyndrickxia ginsengihumi]MCM3024127.1 hypothetical protein [Heyndrickxia ginsengihumi]
MDYTILPTNLLYIFFAEIERNIINEGLTEWNKEEIKQIKKVAEARGISLFSIIPKDFKTSTQ